MRTDRRTNTTDVITALSDYSKAPKIPISVKGVCCLVLLGHVGPGFEFHLRHGYVPVCLLSCVCKLPHPRTHTKYVQTNFDFLLTVHLSIFISVINQLDAHNFCFTISLFHASTCLEHVFIIRRSKLHYTASGIITLKQVSGLKLLKYNSINMSK